MTGQPDCPFCHLEEDCVLFRSETVVALWDRFPVSQGHVLVIPHRHVTSWLETTPEEHAELLHMVGVVREAIESQHHPAGFNIGINVGQAAGQTVSHLHVHVIPRYEGDVANPQGGIRNVVPDRSGYLETISTSSVGGEL